MQQPRQHREVKYKILYRYDLNVKVEKKTIRQQVAVNTSHFLVMSLLRDSYFPLVNYEAGMTGHTIRLLLWTAKK